MKTFSAICLALLAGELSASAQGQEKKIEVIVENPWNAEKVDEPVVIDLSSLGAGFTVKSATVFDGTNEIPSQLDDMNGDTRADELAFVINLPASGKKTLNVTLSSLKSDKTYPARVYAEMLFRTSKKNKYAKGYAIYADGASDTYNVQHHHGAAFESELVAYRIYFNEKQTTDLYGKFHKGLELEESQFYPTGEQLKRGFGDDVIKVNSSCGAGTLRGWDGTQSTGCRTRTAYPGFRTGTYHCRCRGKGLAVSEQGTEHDKPLYTVCRTPRCTGRCAVRCSAG